MDFKLLAAQLRKPEGEAGKEVGIVMNNGNRLINLWTISALQLQPYDTVLEIGMGNGLFAKDVLAVHPTIKYTGCDYSSTMVEEARKLNAYLVEQKVASFDMGAAGRLLYSDKSFSKIFTVNTVYFWGDAEKELGEVCRVLKKDGVFVVSVRTKKTMDQMPYTEFGFVKYTEAELTDLLQNNGFEIVHTYQKMEPVYWFKGQQILLENIIVSCRVKFN